MCTHRDWSRRMAEAHELSKRLGVRVWLTTYRTASIGASGHVVWSQRHYVAVKTSAEADRDAQRRYWTRGMQELEAVLGGEGK